MKTYANAGEDPYCHEGIVDEDGDDQPCERNAVAYRIDPDCGKPYPVCRQHHRAPYWLTARAKKVSV